MMKRLLKPDGFLKVWTLFLCAVLFTSVYAQGTNGAPDKSATTNSLSAKAVELAKAQKQVIQDNRSLLSFGLDKLEPLQLQVLNRPLWQYLATLVYVMLAFYVAKIADKFINQRLRAITSRTENQWDDILVNLADGPVKLVVFVVLLNIGLQLFDWPAILEHWFAKLTILAVGASVLMMLLKAVDALISLWRNKLVEGGDKAFNEHFLLLVGKMIKAVIGVVAVFTVLGNLGFDISAALASASVLGLALGLAAQDTVGNLFGAVAVFIDKPFKIGDRVRIGDTDGTVEEMGLRSTRIRNLDGFLVTVPNKEMGSARVINISRRPTIRTPFVIGLTYDTPAPRIRRAVELIQEIFGKHPQTHDLIVHFNKFGDFSVNLDVVYWCKLTDFKEYAKVFQDLNLELKSRFDAEGLQFAFPTQTLYVEKTSPSAATNPVSAPTTR